MEVVPVIDLMGGVVVRAVRGERAAYRPIETPLCRGSAPLDVVAGLLSLHDFSRLYVADLDAIEGRAPNEAALAIAERFPELDLWVDNGCADPDAARAFLAMRENWSLVIGSESQHDAAMVRLLRSHPKVLLSLDFSDGLRGPEALLRGVELWPERLIVMTLQRVGSGAGPDLERFEAIKQRAGQRRVYAAGGVRGPADLVALAERGAAGVLVATALHNGRLGRAELSVHAGRREDAAQSALVTHKVAKAPE